MMPAGAYKTGAATTRIVCDDPSFDPDNPDWIRRYFRLLFQGGIDTDGAGIQAFRRELNYPEVAARFRMIDDDTEDVVVSYGTPQQTRDVDRIVEELRRDTVGAWQLLRRLQPFLVSIRKRKAEQAEAMFCIMIEEMNDALKLKRFHNHTKPQELPAWLS